MLFWACFNSLILTGIGYYFIAQRAEQQALAYLNGYLSERVRAESQVFRVSERNLGRFRDSYLASYGDPQTLPTRSFDQVFVRHNDGSIRSRRIFFTGTHGADGLPQSGNSAFIGTRHAPLDADLRRRIMLSLQMVSSHGPAWREPATNLYALFPENVAVVHWPGVPWGLEIPSDSFFAEEPIGGASFGRANPGRKAVWSELYPDEVSHRWMVSHQLPVYLRDRFILSVGEDIELNELVARLDRDHPIGGTNLLLAKTGRLIARPQRASARPGGSAGEAAYVKEIYNRIRSQGPAAPGAAGETGIVMSKTLDAYIGYGSLAGPDGWFVTIYPRSLVAASARDAARGLLILGLMSFALMTLVVVSVLRQRVAGPIGQMKVASERVSEGEFEAVASGSVPLPVGQNNEIGLLAISFRGMAKTIGTHHQQLEATVAARTRDLQAANVELEKLTFKDALTGAYNRRGFDRDLMIAIEDVRRGTEVVALMLCDIDFFKLYNDTYGHPAGDGALYRVSSGASEAAPSARLYRYGGEELALILRAGCYADCLQTAADVVRAVAGLDLPHRASNHGRVTISAGLAEISADCAGPEAIIAAADANLYRAKREGRNQLISA